MARGEGPRAAGGPTYGWDGGSFATYNIAVEELSTYFAGPLGVWVHNEGVGRPPACQRVASLYLRFRRDEGRSPMGAFERLMELSSSPSRRAQIDPHLREVARQVTIDLYIESGGDLKKIPTVEQMRATFARQGSPFNGRIGPANIETHHAVPEYVQRALGITDVDGAPAMPLHFFEHRAGGEVPTSFHSILSRKYIPLNKKARDRVLGNDPGEAKQEAKRLLREAYAEWIRVNDLSPEVDDALLNAISRAVDDWITPPTGGG
jgi:hypothetical protein